MRFDLDGTTYDFDETHIPFAEFRYLKQTLGISSGDFFTGVLRLDVEALAAVVLLTMKRQAVMSPGGKPFRVEDLDNVNMVALIESVAAHGQAKQADADAAAADDLAAERAELAAAIAAAEADVDVDPAVVAVTSQE